ncbi:MAG: adenylyltransferase/cytidyltransferase family protein, partial [Acidobacteria bacterium]|nr:adenylyltransferase/cytidyltransferase family protein [Acidobacteriota bacterium]
METYRSLEQAAAKGDRAVVTIGNFDGIHLAHQQLLRRARQCARELNA